MVTKVKETSIISFGQPVKETLSTMTFASNPSGTNVDELRELCTKEVLRSGVVKDNNDKAAKMARRAINIVTSRGAADARQKRVEEACPSVVDKFSLLAEEMLTPHYQIRIDAEKVTRKNL